MKKVVNQCREGSKNLYQMTHDTLQDITFTFSPKVRVYKNYYEFFFAMNKICLEIAEGLLPISLKYILGLNKIHFDLV